MKTTTTTYSEFMELGLLEQIAVLQQMMPGWRVQAGDVEWDGTPTVQVGIWGREIIPGKFHIWNSEKSGFLGNPRNLRINIRDFTAKMFEDISTLGLRKALGSKLKGVTTLEKFDDAIIFLECIDWNTSIKRWYKFINWLGANTEYNDDNAVLWDEKLPRNMVAWACRHILGGIGVSRTLRKNIKLVEFDKQGIAHWKSNSHLWSEYIFRSDDEARQVLGWSGALNWRMSQVWSTDKDSPICRTNKVPDKWEEESGIFHRLVKREKE